MDNYNQDHNQNSQNNFSQQTTVQTSGNKPKTIHVAHRRSPSELTTLMRKYSILSSKIFFFILCYFTIFYAILLKLKY